MRTAKERRGEQTPEQSAAERAAWGRWMQRLGGHVRRVREFLGFSQEQLATAAGVSQGAVSRFEHGRGINAPFVVILKINVALAHALSRIDPSLLSEDVRRFLKHMAFLALPPRSGPPTPGGKEIENISLAPHPELERLLRLYQHLPEVRRQAFLAAMTALAEALRE